MHSYKIAVATFLLAAVVLSGCTSSTPDPKDAPSTSPTFGSDSGAIEGVVTNAELEPIRNAQVALQDGSAEPILTPEDGSFHFSELAPGKHVLFVTALGYASVARNVDVAAGQLTPIRVQLAPLSMTTPFSVSDIKEGYIACGTGSGADGSGFTQVACGDNDPNQQFLFNYTFAKGLKGILFEMTWKPTQALSKDLVLNIEKEGCGFTCGTEDIFSQVQGCCYIRVALPVENMTKPAGDLPASDFQEKAGTIQTRTFPAFGEQGRPITVFTAQEFQIHVEYFYLGLPEDWATRSNVDLD